LWHNKFMKLINRTEELERLNRVVNLNKSSLIVIYGRRRIGKTRLLLEWVKKNNGLYWVADESSSSMQRLYFSQSVNKIIPGFSDVAYPDWRSLLDRLAREAKSLNWRGPLVIDELPYLVQAAPEFSSILQRFVDHGAKEAKLIIAISGSSQRMMQDAVLSRSAPLYGRANEILKLEPMNFKYLAKALSITDSIEAVEAFSIFGGIPFYWELAKDVGGNLPHIAENIILNPKGALHDEPNRLLLSEIPSAMSLKPVLDAIGIGANRLNKIAARLEQPATSISRPLVRLQELGLIERETPFGSLEKESKRSLYKIGDPFLRFWFSAVAPQKSALAQLTEAQRRSWLQHILAKTSALTWEDICRTSIPRLTSYLGNQFGIAGRFWHGQGPEWDVVAKPFEGEGLIIGECKWFSKIPSKKQIERILEELINKGAPPVKRRSKEPSLYVLFLNRKPSEKMTLPHNVRIINCDDILHSL